jgi:hypothetical protein
MKYFTVIGDLFPFIFTLKLLGALIKKKEKQSNSKIKGNI